MLDVTALRAIAGDAAGVGIRGAGEMEDLPEVDALDPSTSDRRRGEFASGRLAARDALADLGAQVVPIPAGPNGAPVWPDGIVGSISHGGGVAVAVVGRTEDFYAIGVDVERRGRRVTAGVIRRVCTAAEREWIASAGNAGTDALVVFSAKEAAFKALAGVGGVRLRFHDVSFDPAGRGTLTGRVAAREAPAVVTARHLAAGGVIVTCVSIPRPDAPSGEPGTRASETASMIDRMRSSLS